jgi:hypothetical protein
LNDRKGLVAQASDAIDGLLYEYFDVLPNERALIEDTLNVAIPSVTPTRNKKAIPAIEPASDGQRTEYIDKLCSTLNEWGSKSPDEAQGCVLASPKLGVAIAVLQRSPKGSPPLEITENLHDLLVSLTRIGGSVSRKVGSFELIRGTKLFDQDRLYIVKPISRRFWTGTAALNDADEIAGTILMQSGAAAV